MTEASRQLCARIKRDVEAIEPEERMEILHALMPWTTRAYDEARDAGIAARRAAEGKAEVDDS
jgi:hypothetical protein